MKDHPGSYEWTSFYREMQGQRSLLIQAWGEAEQSADSFLAAYHAMEKAEQEIDGQIRAAGLAFTPMFQRYAQDNEKPVRDIKQIVSAGFSMLP